MTAYSVVLDPSEVEETKQTPKKAIWTEEAMAAAAIVERNIRAGYPTYSGVVLGEQGYPVAPAPVACPLLPTGVPVVVRSFREVQAEVRKMWRTFEDAQCEVASWEKKEAEALTDAFGKSRGSLACEVAVNRATYIVTEKWMREESNIDLLFDDVKSWRKLARRQLRLKAREQMGRLQAPGRKGRWRQHEYLSDEETQQAADVRRQVRTSCAPGFWPALRDHLEDPAIRLVAIDGMTTRDAAGVLGVSQSSVARRLSLAYEDLSEQILEI